MDQVLFVAGVAVTLLTAASILFTMVLPRSPRGFERLSVWVNRIVREPISPTTPDTHVL